MNRLLIVIPAYNEEESIEEVVNNIKENYSQFDYVIVMMAQRIAHTQFVKKINII